MSNLYSDGNPIPRLLSHLFDDNLTDEEFDHLVTLLQADQSSRLLYLSYVAFDAELESQFACPAAKSLPAGITTNQPPFDFSELATLDPNSLDTQLDEIQSQFSHRVSISNAAEHNAANLGTEASQQYNDSTNPLPSPVLGFLGGMRGVFARPLVWSIALVAILTYGSFVFIAWNLRSGKLPVATNDLAVAVVRDTTGVQWSKHGASRSAESSIVLGEPLKIESGIVQLELKRGVTLLVEGPARWSIEGDNRAILKWGKIIAKVPSQAIGFTVETPQAKIVDLGTEFGIATKVSGETEVNVFRGRVLVEPVAKATLPSHESFVLQAGEAKRIAVGGTVTVANANKTGTWKILADRLLSRQQVFPDSLVAYWGFEKTDRREVPDERSSHHGAMGGSTRVGGIAGRGALRFGNNGERVRIPMADSEGAFGAELTIEAAIISSWSGKAHDDDYIFRKQDGGVSTIKFALMNDDSGEIEGPALAFDVSTNRGVQSLRMPFDGRDGRPTFAEFTNGQPHHIVAIFNGTLGEMSLFVDGVMGVRQSIDKGALLGRDERSTAAKSETRKPSDSLNGVLDEVALYRAALSHKEIWLHWNNLIVGRSFFEQSAPPGR
jgi:hypothetical protein